MENTTRILGIHAVIRGATTTYIRVNSTRFYYFLFRLSGEIRYTSMDRSLLHRQGELMIVPPNTLYSVQPITAEPANFISVKLEADLPVYRATVLPLGSFMDFHHVCELLQRYRAFPTAPNYCRCLALLYDMLATALSMEKTEYFSGAALSKLEPAIRHMERHMFDPDMTIGELHLLCGISDTYFRRLFMARFGVGPKKYVINKRLSQAKSILNSGQVCSVGQAAELVGFDDPLYFSKVFRSRYGCPPSELLKAAAE